MNNSINSGEPTDQPNMPVDAIVYLEQLNEQLAYLYSFARQINELDFAASLPGEFRGAQDAGWATTQTAHEVFEEVLELTKGKTQYSRSEMRVLLMLYCQLAEAGGVYEALKNIMGVVKLKPYLLWPFQDLVRFKASPRRIIGPNANVTFRALATIADEIGMRRLSALLELAFRDDIRNGVSHADYVLWHDGLRLRKRNGGYATKLPFAEINQTLTCGLGFFQLLRDYNNFSMRSFHPPRTILGRFSDNPPMEWTVSLNPVTGSFSLSSDSPGASSSESYQRQVRINEFLGGKVLAMYMEALGNAPAALVEHVASMGFSPHEVVLDFQRWKALLGEIDQFKLWDQRFDRALNAGLVLLASPWGFRWFESPLDFDQILAAPPMTCRIG